MDLSTDDLDRIANALGLLDRTLMKEVGDQQHAETRREYHVEAREVRALRQRIYAENGA